MDSGVLGVHVVIGLYESRRRRLLSVNPGCGFLKGTEVHDQLVKHLCEELTSTETVFPGIDPPLVC